jgi:SAM domain (Sterile alpha motif)
MLVICRLNSPLPCPEARLDKTVREEGASMQAIADWLKELGMSEYADRFAENRIDLSVLPDLTDQHLKDLGRNGLPRLCHLRLWQSPQACTPR